MANIATICKLLNEKLRKFYCKLTISVSGRNKLGVVSERFLKGLAIEDVDGCRNHLKMDEKKKSSKLDPRLKTMHFFERPNFDKYLVF